MAQPRPGRAVKTPARTSAGAYPAGRSFPPAGSTDGAAAAARVPASAASATARPRGLSRPLHRASRRAALRAALLLAALACASAALCPTGRANSVDGVAVATDTYSNANVVISGCNNTVTRSSAAVAVTITGSDDVVEPNVGATSIGPRRR
jgi:hypothetical protein